MPRYLPWLFWIGFSAVLSAQSTSIYSSIVGTVTDPSGSVIAGAAIKIRNVNTGIESTTKTDADGSFRVERLISGVYNLNVVAAGFRTFNREAVPDRVGSAPGKVFRVEEPRCRPSVPGASAFGVDSLARPCDSRSSGGRT